MPKRIDYKRVLAMRRMGFTHLEIAKRLGCSVRQVGRILGTTPDSNPPEAGGIVPSSERRGGRMDGDVEMVLRDFYLRFESGERVAERFGVSRQAILKKSG